MRDLVIILGLVFILTPYLGILLFRMLFYGGQTEDDATAASPEDSPAQGDPQPDAVPEPALDEKTATESADTGTKSGRIGTWMRRAVMGTPYLIGVALLVAGLAVWIRPDLVPAELATQIEQFGDAPETPFLLLGGIVGAVALLLVTFGSRPATKQAIGDVDSPEPITQSAAVASTGEHLDGLLDRLTDEDDWRRIEGQAEMNTYLQEVITESLITHRGWTQEQARRSVEEGTWTPRPEVAAVIGGSDAPDMPLWWRLRDWLSADSTYERRVRRTVVELERVTGREA